MVRQRDRIVEAWSKGTVPGDVARRQLEELQVRHRGSVWRIQPGAGGARVVEVRPDGDVVVYSDPVRRRYGAWLLLIGLIGLALWGFWNSSSVDAGDGSREGFRPHHPVAAGENNRDLSGPTSR